MKDWTGNKTSIFSTLGASSHAIGERQKDDFYATEPSAIDDLFNVENFSKTIWEPCCGQGHLAKRMVEFGKEVIAGDLIDRGYGFIGVDFMSATVPTDNDIITNPPYKYAQEFCEQAIKLTSGKVAMFLKLTFLEGQKRKKFFESTPPSKIYVFSKRKNCAKNGDFHLYLSSAVAYAWFVWEKGFTGNPIIKWI